MDVFRQLLGYAKNYRAAMLLASIYSMLNKFFDILPEVLIGIAVDVVVNQKQSFLAKLGIEEPFTQLWILAVITFAVWGLESLFQYLYMLKWRLVAQNLQHDMRLDAYAHMQRLPMNYFVNSSTGNTISILNDDINQLERFFDNGLNELIQIMFGSFMVGAIFLSISPVVTFYALLPIPFVIYTAFWFRKRLAPLYSQVREQAGFLSARIGRNLLGMSTIKAFAAETYEEERLRQQSLAYRHANLNTIAVSALFIPLIRMAILAGFIATIIIGGWQAISGEINVASYSILIFLTQRFLWPFTNLAQLSDTFERAMASAKRVLGVLHAHPQISQPRAELLKSQVKGLLEYKNIYFSYDSNSKPILQNFSFHVKAGQTIALVGATGAGKSTVIKLLMRFIEPLAGQILIDGVNIADLSLHNLRMIIGFVSQDVYLFDGTIAENIAYGSFGSKEEDIVQAAKSAEAHDFIIKMPMQYKTIVGERGQKLSGGQCQRLSLARAILKNAPIMILDEATSAVDNETEEIIQKSLAILSKNRTTVVIAHRLSTIRHADQILLMDNGCIVESGKHKELVELNRQYAKLWNIQTGER